MTHLAMRLGGAWVGRSVLIGCTRLLMLAGAGHLGERLANTVEGAQPLFSRRPSDRATRVFDPAAPPPPAPSPSALYSPPPSLAALPPLRSEAGVLSMATLMGEGQVGEWLRKGSGGEALEEGGSVMPE